MLLVERTHSCQVCSCDGAKRVAECDQANWFVYDSCADILFFCLVRRKFRKIKNLGRSRTLEVPIVISISRFTRTSRLFPLCLHEIMDPIAAVASCITVAATVRGALIFVQDACGAEAEIFALANEISDISVVFQALGQALAKASPLIPSELRRLAVSTRNELDQLALDIELWKRQPHDKLTNFRQLRWLRIASKAKAWRERLRHFHVQLTTVLSAISASVMPFRFVPTPSGKKT